MAVFNYSCQIRSYFSHGESSGLCSFPGIWEASGCYDQERLGDVTLTHRETLTHQARPPWDCSPSWTHPSPSWPRPQTQEWSSWQMLPASKLDSISAPRVMPAEPQTSCSRDIPAASNLNTWLTESVMITENRVTVLPDKFCGCLSLVIYN